MTYAIISNIYANAIALRAVLGDARRKGAQKIVCLGDVCALPSRAASKLRMSRF